MCGIAGFVNLNGAPADMVTLERMTALHRHRGPDDRGLMMFSLRDGTTRAVRHGDGGTDSGFEGALGFNRLKILDLSDDGHQPMQSADGKVTIAFNGEIYNAFDFKPQLEQAGYRFRSRTDTEVILYLYEHFGLEGMLDRLNGMFAIVILDMRRRELLMIRDQLGIKPLYWAVAQSALLFGSEVKAFGAHPAFRAELDASHIDEYLAFRYIAGEETLLKGVRHLRPGHYARLKDGHINVHRYWSLPDGPQGGDLTAAQALDAVDHTLRASVKSQLLSDVKVGCQLSGGIDSSLVSVFAREHFDADMETFSIVFDDPEFSEERWVSQAAAVARAESHRYLFTPESFMDTIAAASWHMDQPLSHPNALGIWLLARESRKLVTVLLSGEGADELFGGYTRFYYANLRSTLGPWLPALRWIPNVGRRLEDAVGGEPVEAFIRSSQFQRSTELESIKRDVDLTVAIARRREIFEEGSGGHLDRCLKYEMQTYLPDLLVRQDKMTMAHSIENRVPFLDKHLVTLVRQLPTRYLVSDSALTLARHTQATKIVLKQLARRSFDHEFVYRKKSGFPLPLAKYFGTRRFAALMEESLLPGMAARGLTDSSGVRAMWKSLQPSSAGTAEALWISVALEAWAQALVDRRPEPAVAPLAPAVATAKPKPLRVVFCWAEASPYMAACWRELAARPGIELHILHPRQLFNLQENRYRQELDGLSNQVFEAHAPNIDEFLLEAVIRQRPDVIVVCGWIYWPYTRLVRSKALRGIPMILGMDSPWRGSLRQRLGRLRLAPILERFSTVVTAGERSATYARRLGVPDRRIQTGFYGFDFARFDEIADGRSPGSAQWPRQFLFVGRYVPQKDLASLIGAYQRYRSLVTDPWGLTCCGDGPDAGLVRGPGVVNRGFTRPADLPEVFRTHGAFVMASRFEPWGVVLAEAAASGLPLICTTACGASVDLVRTYYNGVTVPPQDIDSLARAMVWMHEHEADLPLMGERARKFAAAFSAEAWAERWHNYLLDACASESHAESYALR